MDQTLDKNLREEVIASLGLEELTSFEQDAIINNLEEKIIEQVNSIILDRLDEEEKAELETLLEDDEISDFLRRAIPDLEEVKQEAARWAIKNWQEEFLKSRALQAEEAVQ